MRALERRDVFIATIGVVALLVGIGSMVLVGAPTTSSIEPAMGGHGGMGGPGGMSGGPAGTTPALWPGVLALVGTAVAFGYIGWRWSHTDGSVHASGDHPDTETDGVEAIQSAYAQGELTDSELNSALERELRDNELHDTDRSTEPTRERAGEKTDWRE